MALPILPDALCPDGDDSRKTCPKNGGREDSHDEKVETFGLKQARPNFTNVTRERLLALTVIECHCAKAILHPILPPIKNRSPNILFLDSNRFRYGHATLTTLNCKPSSLQQIRKIHETVLPLVHLEAKCGETVSTMTGTLRESQESVDWRLVWTYPT